MEKNIETARAEFISIVAFLSFAVVYQPVSESFAAHASWLLLTPDIKKDPHTPIVILMLNYCIEVLSAFAVWIYWNTPGTNTDLHLATLCCWMLRSFLYRMAMTIYQATHENFVGRLTMDSIMAFLDTLFEILVLVECFQRSEWVLLATFFLFLPTLVLDILVLTAIVLWTIQNGNQPTPTTPTLSNTYVQARKNKE